MGGNPLTPTPHRKTEDSNPQPSGLEVRLWVPAITLQNHLHQEAVFDRILVPAAVHLASSSKDGILMGFKREFWKKVDEKNLLNIRNEIKCRRSVQDGFVS